MDRYVAELESVGVNAAARTEQEKQDVEIILGSDLFDAAEHDARRYVRAWASGINPQAPRVDFKPDVYLAQHGVEIAGGDPFADYIRMGCPQGSWNNA
jgi:hypothetical protein